MFFRILLVACFAVSVAQAQDIQYVFAENGLVVREKPNQGAIKVGLLDYGTPVEVIEHTNLNLDIKDRNKKITGEWVKVRGLEPYEHFKEGYVFNGFLTEEKIKRPLKVIFDAFTVYVDELNTHVQKKNEANDEETASYTVALGNTPENRYLKVKHHQEYRTIKVYQRYRNSIAITPKGKQAQLIDFQHYSSSWKPLKMLPSSGNIFKTISFSAKDQKRFGEIDNAKLKAYLKAQCDEDCDLLKSNDKTENDVSYTIVPSQIQLKVVMTDTDGYKTEKIIIFELPMGS